MKQDEANDAFLKEEFERAKSRTKSDLSGLIKAQINAPSKDNDDDELKSLKSEGSSLNTD